MKAAPQIAQSLFIFGTETQANLLAEGLVAENLEVIWARVETDTAWGRAWQLDVLVPAGSAARGAQADGAPTTLVAFDARNLDATPPVAVVRLARWRGARDNREFRDLLARLKVALAPPARPRRRWALRALPLALVPAILGFWANLFGVQQEVCSIGGLQPNLSDLCGSLGLGDKPTQEERIAWEGRTKGSCPALRDHIARFREGAYADDAAILLTAATFQRSTAPVRAIRPAVGYVRAPLVGSRTDALARSAALGNATRDARETLCIPRGADERLVDANIEPGEFECMPAAGGGTHCGLNFRASCIFDTHPLVEHCP